MPKDGFVRTGEVFILEKCGKRFQSDNADDSDTRQKP